MFWTQLKWWRSLLRSFAMSSAQWQFIKRYFVHSVRLQSFTANKIYQSNECIWRSIDLIGKWVLHTQTHTLTIDSVNVATKYQTHFKVYCSESSSNSHTIASTLCHVRRRHAITINGTIEWLNATLLKRLPIFPCSIFRAWNRDFVNGVEIRPI